MLPTAIVVSLLKLVGIMANMGKGHTPVSTLEVTHDMDRVPRVTNWLFVQHQVEYFAVYVCLLIYICDSKLTHGPPSLYTY
jgi:hypothetical protein